MNSDKLSVIVQKMLGYCHDAQKYAIGKTYDEFVTDERSLVFSIFSLSQLGELVALVDNYAQDRYSNIPWRALKGLRNRIVHDYDGVQYKIIWHVIRNEVPELMANLQEILDDNG